MNAYNLRLAGELCDGVHLHPFHSVKYLREFALPNIEAGLAKTGRPRHGASTLACSVVHDHRPHRRRRSARAREHARTQIAFYASTRTYEPVLAAHGWQDLTPRLHRKSVEGDWAGMAALITDEMLARLRGGGAARRPPRPRSTSATAGSSTGSRRTSRSSAARPARSCRAFAEALRSQG